MDSLLMLYFSYSVQNLTRMTIFLACLALSAPISAEEVTTKGPSSDSRGDWKTLFDGKTMKGWAVTDFAGHGDISASEGELKIGMGLALSGINYTNQMPKLNYEVRMEAKKTDGSDFFCGLTFPYKEDHATLICGGWGGGVVGLSCIDSMDASENETTDYMRFEKDVWYRIRLLCTESHIKAWIDDKLFVDVETEGKSIDMRIGEIELSAPFGVATWMTSSAIRNVKMRELPSP